MPKKECLRENGIYLVSDKGGITHLSPSMPSGELYSWLNSLSQIEGKHCLASSVITLIVEDVAPTEKICHEVLSCFSGSTSGLRLLIVVCPIEKNKLLRASRKSFEHRRLWFAVDPGDEVNKKMQAHGFFPDKKYEKKLCIYDYSSAWTELMMSNKLSGIQCTVSVNCGKKINSVFIPGDFLKIALSTKNGIDVSILNERFKWAE